MPDTPEHWIERTDVLERTLAFADFASALAYVNEVGRLAEAANHHPDIHLHDYNNVRLSLTSHDAGGLTDRDFELAAAINQLAT